MYRGEIADELPVIDVPAPWKGDKYEERVLQESRLDRHRRLTHAVRRK
jgi:hypothetical protein